MENTQGATRTGTTVAYGAPPNQPSYFFVRPPGMGVLLIVTHLPFIKNPPGRSGSGILFSELSDQTFIGGPVIGSSTPRALSGSTGSAAAGGSDDTFEAGRTNVRLGSIRSGYEPKAVRVASAMIGACEKSPPHEPSNLPERKGSLLHQTTYHSPRFSTSVGAWSTWRNSHPSLVFAFKIGSVIGPAVGTFTRTVDWTSSDWPTPPAQPVMSKRRTQEGANRSASLGVFTGTEERLFYAGA